MTLQPYFIHSQYIKLDDLLKCTGSVATGGQAKYLIRCGRIAVNHQVEIRRGRKLYPGDIVLLDDKTGWVIRTRPPEPTA